MSFHVNPRFKKDVLPCRYFHGISSLFNQVSELIVDERFLSRCNLQCFCNIALLKLAPRKIFKKLFTITLNILLYILISSLSSYFWNEGVCKVFLVILSKVIPGGADIVVQKCSLRKVFVKILQNSQENTCAGLSFLIKLQTEDLQFHQKGTPSQVFSVYLAKF